MNSINSALLCGANEIVVGVTMTQEAPGGACPENGCADDVGNSLGCPTLYGMAVSCARFNISGTPGTFRLAQAAAPVMSMRAGGGGNASPPASVSSFACSSAGVVRQVEGGAGPWANMCATTTVVGMRFACTEPTIPLR